MAGIPLPALQVQPGGDPTQGIQKAIELKSLLQAQQMHQIQMQQQEMALKDQQTLRALYVKHNGDLDKVIQDAPASGVSPQTIQGLQVHQMDVKKKLADLNEADLKNFSQTHDNLLGALQPVMNAKPEDRPTIWQQQRQAVLQNPKMYGVSDPSQVPQQYPGDDQANLFVATLKGGKQAAADAFKEREVAAQEKTARGRELQGEAAMAKNAPLAPPVVQQYNKQLQDRYNVLNPGKPLPDEFTLPVGAKRQDYEDLDKALEQVEKAQGVKAQQETAAATRAAAASERAEKTGMKPVIGFDAKGNQVFGAASEAKQLGLRAIREVGQAEAEKVTNARSLMPLMDSKDPEDPGVLQMAKSLDARGKLGPLASRWNEFLAGKWGSGDKEYAAFRTKMGLATTALMQVHVGSRGGAFMLEHFEDLANAKKFDGPSLLSALETESRYVKRKAMLPNQSGAPESQGQPLKIKLPSGKEVTIE